MDLRKNASLPFRSGIKKRKCEVSKGQDEDLEYGLSRKLKELVGTNEETSYVGSCQPSISTTKDNRGENHRCETKRAANNFSDSVSFRCAESLPINSYHASGRLEKEFKKITLIGIGGFAKVYHAIHKIDGAQYAVKVIVLGQNEVEEALQEARILASLNHPNVVRYATSWLETSYEDSFSDEGGSSSSSSGDVMNVSIDFRDSDASKENSLSEYDDEESFQKAGKACAGGESMRSSSADRGNIFIEACSSELNRESFIEGIQKHSSPCSVSYILCIQMQFYDETLLAWIGRRNLQYYARREETRKFKSIPSSKEIDPTTNQGFLPVLEDTCVVMLLQAFLSLLKGVKYIHTRGIIHHDLKPANIYVEGLNYISGDAPEIANKGGALDRCCMRIGDFGIACTGNLPKTISSRNNQGFGKSDGGHCLKAEKHKNDAYKCCIIRKKGVNKRRPGKSYDAVGTKVYAAPEQLNGQCNPKSDLYSLGIILFEMLVPFKGHIERASVLSNMYVKGKVTYSFKEQYPNLAMVINSLIAKHPEGRLSIKSLKKKIRLILKEQEY